jgi:hypothetical protein
MIVLAFFGVVVVLVLVVAVFYDLRARRRGLRLGMRQSDIAERKGKSEY